MVFASHVNATRKYPLWILLSLDQISKITHSVEICHLFSPATTLMLVHEEQKQNHNRDWSCVGARKVGPLTKSDLAVASAGVANCNEEEANCNQRGWCWALIWPHSLGVPFSQVITLETFNYAKSQQFVFLGIDVYYGCGLVFLACSMSASITIHGLGRMPSPSVYPIQYSLVIVKEVKKVHQLAHTYGHNFYHVPHYPERACLTDLCLPKA